MTALRWIIHPNTFQLTCQANLHSSDSNSTRDDIINDFRSLNHTPGTLWNSDRLEEAGRVLVCYSCKRLRPWRIMGAKIPDLDAVAWPILCHFQTKIQQTNPLQWYFPSLHPIGPFCRSPYRSATPGTSYLRALLSTTASCAPLILTERTLSAISCGSRLCKKLDVGAMK